MWIHTEMNGANALTCYVIELEGFTHSWPDSNCSSFMLHEAFTLSGLGNAYRFHSMVLGRRRHSRKAVLCQIWSLSEFRREHTWCVFLVDGRLCRNICDLYAYSPDVFSSWRAQTQMLLSNKSGKFRARHSRATLSLAFSNGLSLLLPYV